MKKLTKTQKQAQKAKDLGVEHITSIVKTVFTTVYYNVNSVESVIARGWQGASFLGMGQCRRGVLHNDLPTGRCMSRQEMREL